MSHACDSFEEYMAKLFSACEQHQKESFRGRLMAWFEPIFHAMELLISPAVIAIQAYPSPGSLVLG